MKYISLLLVLTLLIAAGCSSGMSEQFIESNTKEAFIEYLRMQDQFTGIVESNAILHFDKDFQHKLMFRSYKTFEAFKMSTYMITDDTHFLSSLIFKSDTFYNCIDLQFNDYYGIISQRFGGSHIVCEQVDDEKMKTFLSYTLFDGLVKLVEDSQTRVNYLGRTSKNGIVCDNFEYDVFDSVYRNFISQSYMIYPVPSSLVFESCFDIENGLEVQSHIYFVDSGEQFLLLEQSLVEFTSKPLEQSVFDLPGDLIQDINQYMIQLMDY